MASARLRLGVLIPTRAVIIESARRPPLEVCWQLARAADAAGYDAVWVGDSIVARPRLDALTTLGYLAGITTRVRLGTAVLLPSLRSPVTLAHQLANIDQISGGRLLLGLGVGAGNESLAREWAACGADFRRRARRLEEHVTTWRALWTGEPVSQSGSDFTLKEHTLGPLPWTEAGPPVLITAGNGGVNLPAALDRFARLGDGLIASRVYPDECRVLREEAAAALAAHGRLLPDFPIVGYLNVCLAADTASAEAANLAFLRSYYGPGMDERGAPLLGPPDRVIDGLKQYETAGVTDVCLRLTGEDQLSQLEWLTRTVLPAFR